MSCYSCVPVYGLCFLLRLRVAQSEALFFVHNITPWGSCCAFVSGRSFNLLLRCKVMRGRCHLVSGLEKEQIFAPGVCCDDFRHWYVRTAFGSTCHFRHPCEKRWGLWPFLEIASETVTVQHMAKRVFSKTGLFGTFNMAHSSFAICFEACCAEYFCEVLLFFWGIP